ncbi:hypothetical protein DFH09DRAFT_1333175 [Mycena vulgaris]|nr:hypothetical protein DFH09DRAFT_1333175 [Mycena vulgaris]
MLRVPPGRPPRDRRYPGTISTFLRPSFGDPSLPPALPPTRSHPSPNPPLPPARACAPLASLPALRMLTLPPAFPRPESTHPLSCAHEARHIAPIFHRPSHSRIHFLFLFPPPLLSRLLASSPSPFFLPSASHPPTNTPPPQSQTPRPRPGLASPGTSPARPFRAPRSPRRRSAFMPACPQQQQEQRQQRREYQRQRE